MKHKKPLVIFFCTAVVLITADMLLKIYTDGVKIKVIPKIISFDSVHNTGIAFNWLNDSRIFLIITTSILTVGAIISWLAVNYKVAHKKVFLNIAFAFFISGAIGNLYDRIIYGHVRDFICLDFWHNFPVFNFADMCLTVGSIMLASYFIFFTGKTIRTQSKDTKAPQV